MNNLSRQKSSKRRAGSDPRRWVLPGLMCMIMLAAMDTTIVATAIPQMVGDLGGLRLISWVFSVYVLAQTVTIPVYGKLADLYGRKPVLFFGAVVFLVGSVACALSQNMLQLIVFRGIQGLGAGAIMATVNTIAGDLYSIRERAAVQGWLSSVWGMAAIAGPLLGGAFADYASWRWIFLVNVPIGAAAMVLLGLFLHESVQRRQHRIDYAGAVLVMLTLATLIVGLMRGGGHWAWWSWQSALLAALTAGFALGLVQVEKRAAEPVMPGWVWRHKTLVGANLATLGLGAVMMATSIYLPTFLQSVRGQGAIAAGLVLASISIGWPTASSLSGRLYLRFGFRDTAMTGTVLMVLAALGFIFMPQPRPVWLIFLDQILLGAGFGLLSTPLLVGQQAVVGWAQRGVVTGSNMFSRYLGQTLGAGIFGAIFNSSIAGRLAGAPGNLQAQLPDSMDAIIAVLADGGTAQAVADYLRASIALATRNLYVGMTVGAVLMLAVLFIAPRRFPVVAQNPPGPATSPPL